MGGPAFKGGRPHVDNCRRDSNSRPHRLLASSLSDPALLRTPSLSKAKQVQSRSRQTRFLLRPQRVERLRPLRGLRAIILSVDAWIVVAASVHSRASLRYSSRRRGSTVNSAARTQFSAWYS